MTNVHLDLDTRVKVIIEMLERPSPLTSREYTLRQANLLLKKCEKVSRHDLVDKLRSCRKLDLEHI